MIFINGVFGFFIGPILLFIPDELECIKAFLLGMQIMAVANYAYLLWRDR